MTKQSIVGRSKHQADSQKVNMQIIHQLNQASILIQNQVMNHEERLVSLEDNMRLNRVQEKKIQDKCKATCMKYLGGKDSKAYKKISRKVFSSAWRDFKNNFEVASYTETPAKDYDKALLFFDSWKPKQDLLDEIASLNAEAE